MQCLSSCVLFFRLSRRKRWVQLAKLREDQAGKLRMFNTRAAEEGKELEKSVGTQAGVKQPVFLNLLWTAPSASLCADSFSLHSMQYI